MQRQSCGGISLFNKLSNSYKGFLRYRPLINEMVSRDLKVRYRRSVLGYLWSILNPLMIMIVQSFVFSVLFRPNIENFPLYVICGNTVFTFFNAGSTDGMQSIIRNSQLIRKVYIPKYILPVSRTASSFVTMLFNLGAILLVMVFTGAHFYWTALLFWVPLVLLFFFTCGFALALSALATRFRDVQYFYSVVITAWMYLTPLFYPASIIPERFRFVQLANPLYHFVELFRGLVIYGSLGTGSSWLMCAVSSLASIFFGALIFKKMQKIFILYI